MTLESVFKTLNSALTGVNIAFKDDMSNVVASFEVSKSSISKIADPVDLWCAGANIACLEPCVHESPSVQDSVCSDPVVNVPPVKKAVSFEVPVPASVRTPQTASKVKSMLSVWEDKIQRTPHARIVPVQEEVVVPNKHSKDVVMEPILEIPDLDSSIFADLDPILEIPDDLMAELLLLEPEKRVARLSTAMGPALAAEIVRRSSLARPPESVESFMSGKVAAALKLFTGTRILQEFPGVVPSSSSKYKKPAFSNFRKEEIIAEEDIDGVCVDGMCVDDAVVENNSPFFDAAEKDDLSDEDPANHSVAHAVEAAQQVAEEEAAQNELDKSAWLADIEEIKIVSTPAKLSVSGHDWSAVSQKMNLSCTLTPVVPGRRSCITMEPVMVQLGPKYDEDQYEVTDKDTESENEMTPNTRAKKHIPAWCANWRQKAIAQIAVDPESIFGIVMPKCELETIFTEKNYQTMGLARPKRVRGSSGNWTFDKLTQNEIDMYRAKCGQVVKAEGVFIEQ